jgi:predicted KAP-like P-loop ATPase
LVKETREEEETKTIKTPDPTTIEFQDFFETILSDVLGKEDRQLIFVVDNLDRLQPQQALSTWATMRTFFDKNRGATTD